MRRAAARSAGSFSSPSFLSSGLHAHPHVFISSLVAVDFKGTSLERVSVDWTFDELFSQMILADYHPDARRALSPRPRPLALKKGAFDNLRNYHYFLAFYLGGKRIALPPIEDFRPSVRDGRLVYAFSLPLRLPIAAATLELRITIYDDTYYVAFDKMSPSDVACAGGMRSTPRFPSRRPRSRPNGRDSSCPTR